MRPSRPLYDALADGYEEHFAVPHRRAYDDLAWEQTAALLPQPPARIVDAGCGVGRWARRLRAGVRSPTWPGSASSTTPSSSGA
ncbi:hypothetical protein AB0C29_42705, partial [Actinoplanes sp. NPDC048791]